MCHEDNLVYVTAHDEDFFPNSAPYEFTVIEEQSKGKWVVEPLNGKCGGSVNFYPTAGFASENSLKCGFNFDLFLPQRPPSS